MNADAVRRPSCGFAEARVTSRVPEENSTADEGLQLAVPGVPIGARRDGPSAGLGAEAPESRVRAMEIARNEFRHRSDLQATACADRGVQGGFAHERIASRAIRHPER